VLPLKITDLEQLILAARKAGPVRIAVAAAHDPQVLRAVYQAQREGMVQATLVGDRAAIDEHAAQAGVDLSGTEIVQEADPGLAARQVVGRARDGKADIVVKGQVRTADLLSAVLNRDVGIRGRGLLSHVALFELPGMDRLIYLSDSGVIVYPDVSQKLEIINNVVAVARQFGLDEPKVAILAASETVHPKIPASLDALALSKMADQGWVQGAIVDGPLGLDLAISPEAARREESDSPVAGLADILIVPNVEAGNIVAKGLLYFAGARMAGLVVGARVPVIISSRADTTETRYLSLAMATVLAKSASKGRHAHRGGTEGPED
jgi:phosphate butyryltransferase